MSGNRNPNPDELKKSKFDPNDRNRVKQPADAYLIQLSCDILRGEIGKKWLSPEDQYNLSRVSCGLYTPLKNLASKHVHAFLTHVVRGEKAQVEAMIQRDPRLLLEKMQVKDEAGRTIYGTAYQIALGAKDVSPFPEQFGEMVEMIEGYFKQLPNGEEERKKQYAEQFPEGFEKQEEARRMSDSLALNKVFAAIKKDKTTGLAEAKKAVAEFQNYLENRVKGVITTGYHFNEALFEEALKLYDEHYEKFGGFDSPKNRLAAIQVIGGIQKKFTACLAGAACDGFGKVVDEKKALSRSKLLDDNSTSFFHPNLGVSHYVYSYDALCGRAGRRGRGVSAWFFKTYVEQKQQPYQTATYRYKARGTKETLINLFDSVRCF